MDSLPFSLSLSPSLSRSDSNNNNGQTRVYAYVGNLGKCVGARETKEVLGAGRGFGGGGTGYKLQLSGYFVLQ